MTAKKTVLLIEPDKVLAGIYEKYLRNVGFEIFKCSDGQSAIFAADSNKPDVVIMELQLPGHGGVEFLHEFRSYPDWQKIPIIINSITPDRISAQNKKRLGVENYCYKPTSSLSYLLAQMKLALG